MEADDFSEEEYFSVIKQMLTAEDVTKHATWVILYLKLFTVIYICQKRSKILEISV